MEATAKLHGERGVFGTSWRDIAAEADVSVATVYSHFPSLDQLLPACDQLVMERARSPSREAASEVVGDAGDLRERLVRVARELFGFYQRGGPHLEVDARERELPGDARVGGVSARHRARLRPRGARGARRRAQGARRQRLDLPTYRALRIRGVSPRRAAEAVAEVAACLVEREE